MQNQIATIGIIDDDKIYQLIMKRSIEQTMLTKQILQFFDGEEAIVFFEDRVGKEHELPEVIFLDINMPYMNGWQFLEGFLHLQLNPDYKPVIYIVSSSNSKEDIARAQEFTILSGYLVKPVTQQRFIELVQSNLHQIHSIQDSCSQHL